MTFIQEQQMIAKNLEQTITGNVFQPLVKKLVLVGSGTTILCGITIGEKAMIGAGSVVTEDVPDWTIVVGNPAKRINKIDE